MGIRVRCRQNIVWYRAMIAEIKDEERVTFTTR